MVYIKCFNEKSPFVYTSYFFFGLTKPETRFLLDVKEAALIVSKVSKPNNATSSGNIFHPKNHLLLIEHIAYSQKFRPQRWRSG